MDKYEDKAKDIEDRWGREIPLKWIAQALREAAAEAYLHSAEIAQNYAWAGDVKHEISKSLFSKSAALRENSKE